MKRNFKSDVKNNGCSPITLNLDLNKVKVSNLDKKQEFKVELTKDVGLMMKYPSLDMSKTSSAEAEDKSSYMFEVITDCIDSIYDEDQMYKSSETPREEITDFLDALSSDQFQKVVSFFEGMPKLEHKCVITCPNCKKKNKWFYRDSKIFSRLPLPQQHHEFDDC